MPRRHFGKAREGQPYAIEWPEWMVECGDLSCNQEVLLGKLGQAHTIKEAEKLARDNAPGWKKRKGFWYCPNH